MILCYVAQDALVFKNFTGIKILPLKPNCIESYLCECLVSRRESKKNRSHENFITLKFSETEGGNNFLQYLHSYFAELLP